MERDDSVSSDSPLATLITELGGDSVQGQGESFTIDRALAKKKLQEQ